jgi:DNA-binding transcriptional MocR family regulator
MQITIDRNSSQPLYQQLVVDIQRRIRAGTLPPGTRLPTVRELAVRLGVTRLTVHNAYSELQSGGWVEATVGRGTFVASRAEPAAVFEPAHDVSPHGVISDMLRMAQLPGMRSLAMADAAPEFYPVREIERSISAALADDAAVLSYTNSQGDPVLRTTLAELLRQRGLRSGPDEIIIISGVTQGLALTAQMLARPGDTVIVEQPTYLGALNVFTAHGLRTVGVPLDDHGLVVEALEPLVLAHRPRFIYTIPTFQNPSGVCLSPARRAALLALAEQHRVPLIEDDIYSALAYEGPAPPPLKADDTSGLVVYLGSLSKALLPGVRVGYAVAAPPLLGRLTGAKQANDLCSPPLLQRAMALFIQRGGLQNHLRRVLPRYRERRDALLGAMARFFPSGLRWTTPRGGFCVWVALPSTVSATELYLAAIERSVAYAPGDVFFSSPPPQPYLRLAFSTQPPETIDEVVQVLGELIGAQMTRHALEARPRAGWVPFV